uniref:hypothetical protein n=1 Tax=Bacteroides sp. 1001136B_160425_E2 TaxID=2787083 RepID=UPI001E62E5C5
QMYKIKNTRLKLESRISIYTKYFIVPIETTHMLPIRQQPAQNKYSKHPFVLSFKSKEALLTDQ